MASEVIEPLAQFGVAGLMGLLWVWERAHSRMREQQLNDAHQRLTGAREELGELVSLLERNTAALERFEQTQRRLVELLERWDDPPERKRRAG